MRNPAVRSWREKSVSSQKPSAPGPSSGSKAGTLSSTRRAKAMLAPMRSKSPGGRNIDGQANPMPGLQPGTLQVVGQPTRPPRASAWPSRIGRHMASIQLRPGRTSSSVQSRTSPWAAAMPVFRAGHCPSRGSKMYRGDWPQSFACRTTAPRAIARAVIDHQHLGGQVVRHLGFADGTERFPQALRPIARADDDGYLRTVSM